MTLVELMWLIWRKFQWNLLIKVQESLRGLFESRHKQRTKLINNALEAYDRFTS